MVGPQSADGGSAEGSPKWQTRVTRRTALASAGAMCLAFALPSRRFLPEAQAADDWETEVHPLAEALSVGGFTASLSSAGDHSTLVEWTKAGTHTGVLTLSSEPQGVLLVSGIDATLSDDDTNCLDTLVNALPWAVANGYSIVRAPRPSPDIQAALTVRGFDESQADDGTLVMAAYLG